MKTATLFAALAVAVAARASTCIVSGDLDAVAAAGSSSAETDTAALVSGTLSASVESPAFDIRDWTLFETLGIKLNTWPWRGGLFIIR